MNCNRCGEVVYISEHVCSDLTPSLYKVDPRKGTVNPIPTLRDQFAMAALTGILATNPVSNPDLIDTADNILAKAAYRLADAMMETRGKG